jgi:hypothetical protein
MSLADRIIKAVLRKRKMPVSAIEPRAIELGYSKEDIEKAMSVIEKDERVGVRDGTVYELCEMFWKYCPFLSEKEKECKNNGWRGVECEVLALTAKRPKKPKEPPAFPLWG